MENVIHFTQEGLAQAKGKPGVILLDFWAEWCPHCGEVGRIVEELAGDYAGRAIVGKVNVDSERGLAAEYAVRSIPTVVVLRDGAEVERIVGAYPRAAYTGVLDETLK